MNDAVDMNNFSDDRHDQKYKIYFFHLPQLPQGLLQFFILSKEDEVSPAQLFALLTTTIGAACTFAGKFSVVVVVVVVVVVDDIYEH